jgi:hypothetical protein
MNNPQPMLWWVFDSDSKTFSTLPTGPFLVPAFLILTTIWLIKTAIVKEITPETIASESLMQTDYWKQKKQRYDDLLKRLAVTNNDLSLTESAELRSLQKYLYNPH